MLGFLTALVYFLALIIPSLILAIVLIIFEVKKQLLRLYLHIKHKQRIHLMRNYDTIYVLHRDKNEIVGGISMVFKGKIDFQSIQNSVRTKWIEKKENGKFKHQHLRKYPEESCGYFYWLPDSDFKLDNHVTIHDCKPPKNQAELSKIYSELNSQPLPENRSPWMILVFPLSDSFAGEPRYVIFMRCHHCICDGYHVIRMLSHCFLDEKTVKWLPEKTKEEFKIGKFLTKLFYFPRYLVRGQLLAKDLNILHGPKQSGKRITAPSVPYSFARLNSIRKSTGATYNDIAVSCVAGALKKYFEKHCAPPLGNVQALIPVALKSDDHLQFCNRISSFLLPLTLCDATSLERLKKTQLELQELIDKEFYYFNYLIFTSILNRLPAYITRGLKNFRDYTCIITNIPMVQSRSFNDKGDELIEFCVFAPHNLKIAMAIVVSSYNGAIRLGVSVDKAVMESEDMNTLLNCFDEEFKELEKNINFLL